MDHICSGISLTLLVNFGLQNFHLNSFDREVFHFAVCKESVGNMRVGFWEGYEDCGSKLIVFKFETIHGTTRAELDEMVQLVFKGPIIDERGSV